MTGYFFKLENERQRNDALWALFYKGYNVELSLGDFPVSKYPFLAVFHDNVYLDKCRFEFYQDVSERVIVSEFDKEDFRKRIPRVNVEKIASQTLPKPIFKFYYTL